MSSITKFLNGYGDGDVLYGDTPMEEKAKDVITRSKNKNTQSRVARQYYGYDDDLFKRDNLVDTEGSIVDPENVIPGSELEDINRLRSIDSPVPEYTSEYWNDMEERRQQAQRFDMPDGMTADYLRGMLTKLVEEDKRNIPGVQQRLDLINADRDPLLGLPREYAEDYIPHFGFITRTGKYPSTADELNRNVAGSVEYEEIPKKTLREYGRNSQVYKDATSNDIWQTKLLTDLGLWDMDNLKLYSYPYNQDVISTHTHTSENGASIPDMYTPYGTNYILNPSGNIQKFTPMGNIESNQNIVNPKTFRDIKSILYQNDKEKKQR